MILVSLLFIILPVTGGAFDMYPWGKYDYKEYSADLLDGMREHEHLKVWESTISKSLSRETDSLLIKNSEGNTYELKLKPVGKALTIVSATNDMTTLSAQFQSNCAILVDGFWSYEWCHMKEVRQFHLEQKVNLLRRDPDWSLGKQSRMVTLREKHPGDTVSEAKTRRITKIIEYFEGGQKCDETGQARATEVHIICCEGTEHKNYISTAAYYAFLEGGNGHQAGIKLPAATVASITEPDLCTYEMTVCSPLLCRRPSEVLPAPKQEPLQGSDVAQLAPLMKIINTTCLNKQEDWWTYELCFNTGIRQARYELQQSITPDNTLVQKQTLVSKFQLGHAPLHLYSSEEELKNRTSGSAGRAAMSLTEMAIINEAGMVTPTFRTRRHVPLYLRLPFVDGTPCDLDAVNRSTLIDVYCGPKNRLVGIWEDSTCHYHAKVELTALCAFSDFVPYKENSTTIDFMPYGVDPQEEEEDGPTVHEVPSGDVGDVGYSGDADSPIRAATEEEDKEKKDEEKEGVLLVDPVHHELEDGELPVVQGPGGSDSGAGAGDDSTGTDGVASGAGSDEEWAAGEHTSDGEADAVASPLTESTDATSSDTADQHAREVGELGQEEGNVSEIYMEADLIAVRDQFPDLDVVSVVTKILEEFGSMQNLSQAQMARIEAAIVDAVDAAAAAGVEGAQDEGGVPQSEKVDLQLQMAIDGEGDVVIEATLASLPPSENSNVPTNVIPDEGKQHKVDSQQDMEKKDKPEVE